MIVELAIEVPQNEREKSEDQRCFCEFCEISKNTFLHRAPLAAVSEYHNKNIWKYNLHSTFDYGEYIGENDVDMVEVLCYIVILTGLFLIT